MKELMLELIVSVDGDNIEDIDESFGFEEPNPEVDWEVHPVREMYNGEYTGKVVHHAVSTRKGFGNFLGRGYSEKEAISDLHKRIQIAQEV